MEFAPVGRRRVLRARGAAVFCIQRKEKTIFSRSACLVKGGKGVNIKNVLCHKGGKKKGTKKKRGNPCRIELRIVVRSKP